MDVAALVAPPLCWDCGRLAVSGEPLCRECRSRLRWLQRRGVELQGVSAWAPVAYTGPARTLVGALKFRGAAGVAEAMAAQITANAPDDLLRGVLVPVPLHRHRLRRRGFNQAERLATAVAARTGVRVADLLVRVGTADRQVGRSRAARLQLADVFELRGGEQVPDRIVLVDDVITTGATLAACARPLRAGGTKAVRAIAYARTPTR